MGIINYLKRKAEKNNPQRENYIEKHHLSYQNELAELNHNIDQLKSTKSKNQTRLSLLEKRKARVEKILKHDI
ncbi:hypothetical protein [Streptococcus uberis]|uniref:DUF465 domain-containing protein n=1 Tax=Streptococcus uberis TaxID=1349 RepID=A0A6L6GAN7_STRUB|nr:hypothetical protein [Streptococcus uberis]KKF44427.1 hypothetical protein AF61_07275 [Streptococcus uberis EF20/0145]MCK1219933.1 hypothetical protein [Streptococcus uberis]MTB35528.1 hypothetical protein [Streptococcus uberis]MTB38265.1 hypothetical protein [Streptococcus uberis]MTB48728.1 hypothetical protein [Streptococcus uberis]